MKTRVKLYTHRIKSTSTGQLYDVFEIRTPYTTPSRSIRCNNNKNNNNQKTATITSPPVSTTTSTTDPAALTKAFDITSTKKAYAPSYKEACMFLRAIQINRREQLSPQCLRYLATFVVQSWEVEPTEIKVTELMDVMKHLLDTTQIDPTLSDLDEAIKQTCRNPAAIPTVCPTVALLVAMRYIDRLKKKYNNIRGAMGCSHRLVVVAFMMAIKYIHANLRLIIDITEPQEQEEQEQKQIDERRRSSSLDALVFSRLSTERSTLKKPPSPATSSSSSSPPVVSPMVSPPASPKSTHCSQPLPSNSSSTTVEEESSYNKHQRALRALRMEIEFLHFLNYDLTLSDPVALVEWAHRPATAKEQHHVLVDEPSPAPTYSSADEGDDEMESDDASSTLG
ncbi:hypothetical protein BDA99DRAFT_529451 [Phascolomyces articulosus]|uniref:Cyclin N-terminal domain-containing protein n=1 Tax=Phascolomyces articulosus TaxID=60185 RepID=A0AAD5JKU4_9FUNG|nr:hypothetical protein BDA99DRAFT_529451 [Phascolomyces articulosus]